jgi:hypothetical protein
MKSVATLLFSTFATFYGIMTHIIARGACNTRPHKIPLNVKLTQAPPRLRYFRAKSYAGAQGAGFRQRQNKNSDFVSLMGRAKP